MIIMPQKLTIPASRLEEINELLSDPALSVTKDLLKIIDKYGSPESINAQATKNSAPLALRKKLHKQNPSYLKEIDWLAREVEKGAFISLPDYYIYHSKKKIIQTDLPVVLEISSLQYFPWLIAEAKQAIKNKELMPGRFIKVRNMKEQERDGDLLATRLATQVLGSTIVETLDTKGTDGSNVHLGGPATITGYFGGVGQPNTHALKWADEFLYYYTNYGVNEVLNLNPGTILVGYLMYKLGINIQFKISVFMGNDNPYAALWTMLGAKLFSREDGSTPLVGFNWSNSVDNSTLKISGEVRRKLGFDENIRFEHHIIEAYKSIVRQPYNRRSDLVDVAVSVPNISAKHEGGEPEVEEKRRHQSDILDYFLPKSSVLSEGLMSDLLRNYLDKHNSLNLTARELVKNGQPVFPAKYAHLG